MPLQQYKRDRDPRELLFQFGRCLAHFAVDDQEVRFCTYLKGKASWFLPFNKGWNDGAGNPPESRRAQDRLPLETNSTKPGLTDILENYAQIVEKKTRRPARKSARRYFPGTTSLMWSTSCWRTPRNTGAGQRYLIQHSAGSGKSNSIAWLAHQLIGIEKVELGNLRLRHRGD